MKEFFKENIIQILVLILFSMILIFGIRIISAQFYEVSSFENLKSTQDRIRCAESLGWNVDKGSETVRTVFIPNENSDEFAIYNDMQKLCGFDLEPYMGKSAEVYTYRILDFPSTAPVNAFLNIIVSDEKLIGGDCIVDEYDELYLPLIKPDADIAARK